MRIFSIVLLWVTANAWASQLHPSLESVRIKEIAHLEGARDNALVGYGIVVGLAGTGDSSRSGQTVQSISNTLTRFGVRVTPDQINSRNVAAVVITATLPPFVGSGDKIDINIASMGDARSLTGGTLMLAPLKGADDKIYALAQGPVSVGGFRYDAFGNLVQKNHPTVGQISGGATLEAEVETRVVNVEGTVNVVLDSPDYTTASRIAEALQHALPLSDGDERAHALDAGHVAVHLQPQDRENLVALVEKIENTRIVPDQIARVVVNERTGTVVSGGDVRIGQVSVAQGDLKIDIATQYDVSQPLVIGRGHAAVQTTVVPQTDIKIKESERPSVSLPAGTSVADLVVALNRIKASPRDVISILQAIKRAGSLRAELIIQ